MSVPLRPPPRGLLADGSLLLALMRFNLESALEYRTSFIAQVFFMVLNDVLLLFFWWVLFQRFPDIQGWRMDDVLLLYALGTVSFGLSAVLFGNVMRLGQLIQEGEIDYFLTLPRPPLIHALAARTNVSAWGDILFGAGLITILTGGDPWALVRFFLVVLPAVAVFVSFGVLVHSAAFLLGSAQDLAGLMQNALMTFSLYPETLFSGWVKFTLFTAIPAGLMAYLPVSLIHSFDGGGYAVLVLGALVFTLLGRAAFHTGLRRYESGSKITARL